MRWFLVVGAIALGGCTEEGGPSDTAAEDVADDADSSCTLLDCVAACVAAGRSGGRCEGEACMCNEPGSDADVAVDGDDDDAETGDDFGDAADTEAEASDRPPRVSCTVGAERFPDPIETCMDATDPDGDLVEEYSWRLESAPEGSAIDFVDPGTPCASITPDVPGYYVLCASATANGLAAVETCCRYSAASAFEWAFLPDDREGTWFVEDMESRGGSMRFVFEPNQPVEMIATDGTVSDAGWSVHYCGGASSWRYLYDLCPTAGSSDVSAIGPGDEVSIRVEVNALLTGEHSEMTGSIVLRSWSDPGTGMLIENLSADPIPWAGVGRAILQFAPGRGPSPPTEVIGLSAGGFLCGSPGATFKDDGTGGDAVADDGIFTWLVPASVCGARGIFDLVVGSSGSHGPYAPLQVNVF